MAGNSYAKFLIDPVIMKVRKKQFGFKKSRSFTDQTYELRHLSEKMTCLALVDIERAYIL